MSQVCVKASSYLPRLIHSGSAECPLSSQSSNYPSVSPRRQMLREPSPIRHSTTAWQTQYRKSKLSHSALSHKFSPSLPVSLLQLLPQPTVDADYIKKPIHVQPPAVGCNLFCLQGRGVGGRVSFTCERPQSIQILKLSFFVPGLLIPALPEFSLRVEGTSLPLWWAEKVL